MHRSLFTGLSAAGLTLVLAITAPAVAPGPAVVAFAAPSGSPAAPSETGPPELLRRIAEGGPLLWVSVAVLLALLAAGTALFVRLGSSHRRHPAPGRTSGADPGQRHPGN